MRQKYSVKFRTLKLGAEYYLTDQQIKLTRYYNQGLLSQDEYINRLNRSHANGRPTKSQN